MVLRYTPYPALAINAVMIMEAVDEKFLAFRVCLRGGGTRPNRA